MRKITEAVRTTLAVILSISIVVSFIFAIGGEFMPAGWIMLWTIVNIVSIILWVYLQDSRTIYRKIIPLLVCIASILYKPFKFLFRLKGPISKVFKSCYKIRKMAGGIEQCYYDVQEVYDEYSGYGMEDAKC